MPGVEELLERLGDEGRLVGLITGNTEPAAHIKLARADLNRYFAFGGYGSDAEDRVDVCRKALDRAELVVGRRLDRDGCIAVGDTPLDVEAGHGAGIRVLGVATGEYTVEALRDGRRRLGGRRPDRPRASFLAFQRWVAPPAPVLVGRAANEGETMSKVRIDISVSLDGFVAGPDQSLDDPLGKGGEGLHEWVTAASSWRERHGQEGGEDNADSRVSAERIEGTGAEIMGRKMFSGGSGPWESDPNAAAWWGDDPPFQHPVFVLTHHAREPVSFDDGTAYNFVTDGIESALERAREAAGDKDVLIAGGAQTPGSTSPPGWWTSSSSTSPRCCSAAASGCSTTSGPTYAWSSTGWSTHRP